MLARRANQTLAALITETSRDRAFLTLAFVSKAVITAALYTYGFTGVSADEYTRSISAMEWAQAPHLIVGKTTWLPFELYLDGTLLRAIPDPLWIPRFTVFVASCLLILFFFKLVRLLLASSFAAAASAVGLIVFPWYAWMGATPMLDEYYLAAMIAGLFYAARWAIERKTMSLYAAATAFFLSTGFHYQSWLVLAVIDVAGLWLLLRVCRTREWRHLAHQCVALILAHAYIVFTVVTTYLDSGDPFAFLTAHNEYSKWFYDGYTVSWIQKILYYPKLLIAETNPVFGVFALFGASLPLAKGTRLRARALLMLGVAVLASYCVFNVWSVPPTAAPGRFALVFYLLLLPYAGLAFTKLTQRPAREPPTLHAAEWPVIASLVVGAAWGLNEIRHTPMSQDWNGALQAGYTISDSLRQANPDSSYLIELDFWEFLGVKLTAGHFDHQRFDRHFDLYQMQSPSLLQTDIQAFADQLRAAHVVVMAFRTPALIERAQRFGEIIARDRDWVVLRVRL